MLDFNIFASSNNAHSFPDPALEALMTAEALTELRNSALSEEEYMHWDSRVSEAEVEHQWWKEQMNNGT